ncbi:hypothetical protein AB2L28_02150 [Kineococcus sp. TBRC 1896]|uniref:Uncharacterized protein n=1 Tax=Kineococcus mangrovi TaxID=1660183 RepID=A0ABV4I1E1_9ACTN
MNRRTTLTLTALAAPALALALAASSSAASTPDPATGTAPGTVTGEVTRAVTTSPATSAVPAGSFAVTDVRVAGPWAAADLEPTDPAALDPATAVLRYDPATGWVVVDLGTAGVGCDVVPVPDRDTLALNC